MGEWKAQHAGWPRARSRDPTGYTGSQWNRNPPRKTGIWGEFQRKPRQFKICYSLKSYKVIWQISGCFFIQICHCFLHKNSFQKSANHPQISVFYAAVHIYHDIVTGCLSFGVSMCFLGVGCFSFWKPIKIAWWISGHLPCCCTLALHSSGLQARPTTITILTKTGAQARTGYWSDVCCCHP